MADVTSVTPLLEEVWAPTWNKTFSEEIVALSRIERSSAGITNEVAAGFGTSSGRYVVIPLNIKRNQGLGSRTERTTLPSPGQLSWTSSKVRLRTQYAIGDITVQALELANSNPQSFINTLEVEQESMRTAAKYDYARQVYGKVRGDLASISSYVVGTGVATLDATAYPYGNQHFVGQRGMTVDVVDPAGPTVKNVGSVEVTAISSSANTVTLSGTFSIAPASGDVIVRRGDYNQEINGFEEMIQDSGSFQELDPATVPEWAAYEKALSSVSYTDKHIFSVLDYIRRTSSDSPSVVFTGLGMWRSIYDYLDGDRRFNNTVEFAHGVNGIPLHFKGKTIPIVDDPLYPENPFPTLGTTTGNLTFVCEDKCKVYRESRGWHYAEETGSMFINNQAREDSWEFRMRQHSQFGTSLRNCHARLTGVLITA